MKAPPKNPFADVGRPRPKLVKPEPESEDPRPNGHDANGIHHWTDKLRKQPGKRGGAPSQVLATQSNLVLILAHDPALAGLLGFDEFRGEPVILKKPPVDEGVTALPGPYPRPWTEQDITALHSFVERNHTPKFRHAGPVERAMLQVCGNTRSHPIRDWINGLVWDGEPRLNSWLHSVFGVERTHYTEAVARKTLVAAVRRIRQPGCKFDHILVLQGSQDYAKSLAVEKLATTQYFSDSLPLNLADKDAMIALRGRWFMELSEIEHIARNTTGLTKAFITRHTDIYRAPYGKQVETHPRQCIIIGTTNEQHYLRDDTGNRRYWPVLCQQHADIDWIEDNREQLFAEAAHREAKEQLWIDAKLMPEAHAEAVLEQAARLEAHDDPWGKPIADYLNGDLPAGDNGPAPVHEHVLMSELLTRAVQVPRGQQNSGHARRAARILRAMKWADRLGSTDEDPYGRSVRYWFRA